MRYDADFIATLWVIGAVYAMQSVLSFSLPLLALELTGQGTGLALIKGAGFIPNILFAIFIGVINDRIRKAAAFRGYSVGLALSAGVLCLAVLSGRISVPGLALYMIVMNGLAYAMGNAQMGLLRLTVPEARLSDATSLIAALHSVIATIAPAVAGFALVSLGHSGLIAAATGIFALTALVSFRLSTEEDLPPAQPFWPALREGAAVLWANKELVAMTVVIVLTNAAEGAFETAFILKMKLAQGLSEFQIGLVLAAGGVGAVIASSIAAPLRRRLGYRAAFYWPIWLLAGLFLLMLGTWPFWMLLLISFIDGAVALFFAIGVWSYRQESTAAVHMGRVAGLTGAIFKIGMPPVIVLSGALTDAGLPGAVFWMAAGLMALAALYLTFVARWGWPVPGQS